MESAVRGLHDQVMKARVNRNYVSFARRYSKATQLADAIDEEKLLKGLKGVEEKTSTSALQFMNEAMVAGTFNYTLKAALKEGHAFASAVKIADEVAFRANGVYLDVFRPRVISSGSILGKAVAPLSTYVFNAANALSRDVLFSNLSPAQKIGAMGSAIATATAVNAGVGVLTGKHSIDPTDAIPFFSLAKFGISGPLSAAVNLAQGKPGKAAETAFLSTFPKGGGLQMLKTAKGAWNMATGDNQDPRQLISGPIKPDQ